MYNQFRDQGVVFLGLTPEGAQSIDESQAFLDDTGMSWANGYGAMATIDALGVTGIPSVFVVGADGRIAWNSESGGSLEAALEEALAAAKS